LEDYHARDKISSALAKIKRWQRAKLALIVGFIMLLAGLILMLACANWGEKVLPVGFIIFVAGLACALLAALELEELRGGRVGVIIGV
jgi:uncharacterized membrane protein